MKIAAFEVLNSWGKESIVEMTFRHTSVLNTFFISYSANYDSSLLNGNDFNIGILLRYGSELSNVNLYVIQLITISL